MIGTSIFAIPASGGKWFALYMDRDGDIVPACDARGRPLRCDSRVLAHSVSRYRMKRLRRWK
jgi:hypothetical protein